MGYLEKLDDTNLSHIKTVGRLAQDANMRSFVVGGVVRDLVLGQNLKDLDIAIEGDAIKVAQEFAKKIDGQIVVYKSFGTATVTLENNFTLDFAMTRTETYKKPGAMPSVKLGDIFSDLSRRDITINAMAINISPDEYGTLLDEFNGLDDLNQKIVKVLHANSFNDDPTRLFRVVRYNNRFNFTIDDGTLDLMKGSVAKGCLKTISVTRIQRELKLIKQEDNADVMCQQLEEILGDDPTFCNIYKGV